MTPNEARYVIEHREMYDDCIYVWAIEIIEHAERQNHD